MSSIIGDPASATPAPATREPWPRWLAQSGRRRLWPPTLSWGWWLPAALAVLYALVVLSHLDDILHQIWEISDSDAPGVFAQLYAAAPAGVHVTLGDHAYFEEVAFMLLTRFLPAHRALWYAIPVICDLVGLGVLTWSIRRAFGDWAAAVAAAMLVCLATSGLSIFFAPDAHANSVVHAVLLAAGAGWVLPRIHELSTVRLVAIGLALGLLSGLPLAGDDLFIGWGIAPLAIAAGLAAWRGPRADAPRTVAFGAGTVLLAFGMAAAFAGVMHAEGFHAFAPSERGLLTFATPAGLARNLGTMLEAVPWIGGGDFYGNAVGRDSELALLSAALLFGAALAVVVAVRRAVVAAGERPPHGGAAVTPRFIHIAFWSTCLAAGLLMFLIGSPGPGVEAARYLLGPFVAIIALLPVLPAQGLGWKLAVTAGTSLYAVAAIVRFVALPIAIAGAAPSAGTAGALAQFAAREHVRTGYAYYWDSLDLTWSSEFHVEVFPVRNCAKSPPLLCANTEVAMSSWYAPRAHSRSMLVVDPAAPQVNALDPAFGPPIASATIGGLIVYVYDYDIASRLGHD